MDPRGVSGIRRSTLAAAGRSVDSVHTVEPSLEDIFVSLVRAGGGAVVG